MGGIGSGAKQRHGMTGTRFYIAWKNFRARCNNPTGCNESYKGISYDKRWDKFENFMEDMYDWYSDDLELDRIDPYSDYSKDNCRWVDETVQATNKKKAENTSSEYYGVSKHKSGGWQGEIRAYGKRYYCGYFNTEKEAAEAVDSKIKEENLPNPLNFPKKLRYACLFSGIGAPLQGAYRVYGKENIEHVFSCEFDKFARQSFEANYDIEPEHFHKDVNDLDATQYRGKVDILIGGSPCQAFSIAGLRNGTKDERGQLIYQYIRVVEECKPDVIVYENVKGMMSITGGRTIKEFVQALRDIGYYCHYDVINTKDYGVPQNRERLFLVGFLDHEAYHRFHFAEKQPLEKRLKDVLEDDVDEKYYLNRELNFTYESQANTIHDTEKEAPTICAFTHGYAGGYIQVPSATKQGYETATTGDSINLSVPNSKTRRGRVGKQVAQCLDTACNQAVVEEWHEEKMVCGECGHVQFDYEVYGDKWACDKCKSYNPLEVAHPKICAMRGRNPDNPKSRVSGLPTEQMLEINDSGTSNCLTSVQKDNYVLESTHRIRKLTPRECLRLQDFPDTFIQIVSDSQAYKQAGNSMSVNILEMIFNQIEKAKSNAPTNTLMDFIGETA